MSFGLYLLLLYRGRYIARTYYTYVCQQFCGIAYIIINDYNHQI